MKELILAILTAGIVAGGKNTTLVSAVADACKLMKIMDEQLEKEQQANVSALLKHFEIPPKNDE